MPRAGRPPELTAPTQPLADEPVSRAAFARMLKCAPARVTEWVQRGTISGAALAGMSIIPSRAVEQLRAAECFGPTASDPDSLAAVERRAAGPSYDQARTATEVLKAHAALLDIRERAGSLVDGELADGVLFDCMRAVRDAWLTWPVRVVAEMAARLRVDPGLLLAELERGIKDQLTSLADPKADWRSRAKAARAASVGGTP